MSELLITKNEYDKSVILVDFLSEFKSNINGNQDIKNVVFTPVIAGYCIRFDYKKIPSEIELSLNKSKFSVKMKVDCKIGNQKEKTFISKSKEDNQEILNKLFIVCGE